MSSRPVRQWFRTTLAAVPGGVPFKETVNSMPNPKGLPDLWATVEFQNSSEQRMTLGGRALFREYGTVNIVILGLSGKGDEDVLDAAELYRSAFSNISVEIPAGAEVGTLRIDAPEPPNTDATESGNWFLASVSCPYTFDVVRG